MTPEIISTPGATTIAPPAAPAEATNHASTPEHAGEQAHEHEAQGKGHGKHDAHGGHDGGHGGGHGGTWLVTYCDMVTLLIAFFICILTFASKESGKGTHHRLRDSVLPGTRGTGVAGPEVIGGDQDAILWRHVLISTDPGGVGASIPPLYSDPVMSTTAQVLAVLEKASTNSLANSYDLSIPWTVLFADAKTMTPVGKQLLAGIANNVRRLPYDLYLQVANQGDLSRGLLVYHYLVDQSELPAGRVAVGVANLTAMRPESIKILLVKNVARTSH